MNNSFESKVDSKASAHVKRALGLKPPKSDSLSAVSGVNNTETPTNVATKECTHTLDFKRNPRSAKNKLTKLLRNRERRRKRGEGASKLKLVLKNCKLNGIKCTGLIDDGAEVSGIKPSFIKKIAYKNFQRE